MMQDRTIFDDRRCPVCGQNTFLDRQKDGYYALYCKSNLSCGLRVDAITNEQAIANWDAFALTYTLGKNATALVPEEHQHRITGEFRPTEGVEPHFDPLNGKVFEYISDSTPVIILSTLPAPEPEPKTDREMLEEAYKGMGDQSELKQKIQEHLGL